MKKTTTLIVALIAMVATQIHTMEPQQVALNKEQQKEFRAVLASYRGAYLLKTILEYVGKSEVKAESRLRKDLENLLNDYRRLHGNDPYVADKFARLEKFKNKEVPAIFKQISDLKKEDI